jgi:hypothetical protein
MNVEKIETLEQLKKEAIKGLECFIALNGNARSSKDIFFNGKKYEILHYIDGVTEKLSEKKFAKSFIVEAMNKGALYKYL